jgi:hypothetical protein
VRREQLEHLLRAASTISGDRDILVVGSQAILASVGDDRLPVEAVRSIEADLAFFDDNDDEKSMRVDWAIGEDSLFHRTHRIYAHGVGLETASLPRGWRRRLVVLDTSGTAPGRGLCLERHDLVASKLAAGRPKDYEFAEALVAVGLINLATLKRRIDGLALPEAVLARLRVWVERVTSDEDG